MANFLDPGRSIFCKAAKLNDPPELCRRNGATPLGGSAPPPTSHVAFGCIMQVSDLRLPCVRSVQGSRGVQKYAATNPFVLEHGQVVGRSSYEKK